MPIRLDLSPKALLKKFLNNQLRVYSVFYLCGIGAFIYLTCPFVHHRTYLSENALSPGLVSSDISMSEQTRQLNILLRQTFKNNKENIQDILCKLLRDNGIEAYKQRFSYNLSENSSLNVYGIVRAPRTASTEAILLVAQLYVHTQDKKQLKPNILGLSQTLTMVFALRRKPYMSKDIIVLFSSEQELGAKAWLKSYYHAYDEDSLIKADSLPAHAGSIQAGLSLEFPSDKFYSIDLRFNGLNGQLANLDLINTLIQLCDKQSIPVTFNYVYVDLSTNEDAINYLLKSAKTLLLNLLTLSTGVSDGLHGQFLHYRVEMVTLFGSLNKQHTYQHSPITIRAIENVLEGYIRSINNLLERFHQSFFFYYLINRRNFVSISAYIIPLGIICAPLLLRALVLYMTKFFQNDDRIIKTLGRKMKFPISYEFMLKEFLTCSVTSFVFYTIFNYFYSNQLLSIFLLIFTAIFCLNPVYYRLKAIKTVSSDIDEYNFDFYQFLLLIYGAALLACLSLLNHSLAFLCSLYLLPLYALAGISKFTREFFFVKYVTRFCFVVIFNPILILFIYYLLTVTLINGWSIKNVAQFLTDMRQFFTYYRHFFHIWTYDVVCLGLLPLWLALYRSTYWKWRPISSVEKQEQQQQQPPQVLFPNKEQQQTIEDEGLHL
ncbi:unnamed protein product, partial [Didymodactylos carnosus]